ncbi:two-component system, cell cycle sensor histidine kinase and response regulator CckA [Rhodovulum sp. ES.010]|uniref:ATP-binding protein n=1 Tax=Rhodovulum sp. ES.010 TaxID=1882821 RepID=UPI00092B8140|nr:ATP-binding protein [Rhodovulum sp. ES.010]SIO15645.1 two-component system, cell cycle sensor histidine kinase and response regulator CckA [Rhodovulum sp. ES.010]
MPRLLPAMSTVRQSAAAYAERAWAILLGGIALALIARATPMPWLAIVLLSVAATLAVLAAFLRVAGFMGRRLPAGRLRRICAGASGACVLTDGRGEVLLANPAALRRVAVTRGRPFAAALAAVFADPDRAVADLLGAARRGETATHVRPGADGAMRLRVERAAPGVFTWHLDSAGTIGGDSALPMLRLDARDRVLALNAAARHLLGETPATLAQLRQRADGTCYADGEEIEIDTADGPQRRRLMTMPTREGQRELYLLPAGRRGRAQQDAPDGLLDALPVAILRLDTDGTVRLSNTRARQLLDHSEQAGINLCDHLDGLGRPVSDWLAEAAEGRTSNASEILRVVRPDRELFVQVALAPMEGGGLVAVLHDVTEMKTLEAQFTQSQKMQAIGQLAGGVAHDFNNLLTAISGHCDLLMLRHDTGDPDYADLVQIHQNANRAASLVGQLLAFSRKQTLSPEVLDLRDTMGELAHLLDRLVGEKVRLRIRHGENLPAIRADKRKLEQVVMNLVVNARDAMPRGGEIRLETEILELDSDMRRDRAAVPAGTYALVRVRDEGEGIPGDKLPKIFEPFFTTKRPGEGTGLGLSTVYGIVKQTGGFIFVDSEVGEGSTFTLYLPAYRGGAEQAAGESETGEDDLPEGGVVLLVEDEAPVRSFAARALALDGHTVLEAETGEEALDLLADAAMRVDVFVTDVVMPGLDGPSWVAQALEDRPGTRVVFVSGYAEDSFGEIRGRIPHSVYLPKPFSLADLTATVQRQLRSARADLGGHADPAAAMLS